MDWDVQPLPFRTTECCTYYRYTKYFVTLFYGEIRNHAAEFDCFIFRSVIYKLNGTLSLWYVLAHCYNSSFLHTMSFSSLTIMCLDTLKNLYIILEVLNSDCLTGEGM